MIRTTASIAWIAAVLFGIGAAMSRAAETAPSELEQARRNWSERAQQLARLRIQWQPATGLSPDRFARYGTEWGASETTSSDANTVELLLDGDRLLYSAWRMAARPHGYDPEHVKSITAAVGVAHPDRIGTPFLQALLAGFADPFAEQRPRQRFQRSFDGATLHDFCVPIPAAYPRATLHRPPDYGSDDWATLQYELDPTDQLQTLELMALLLAVRPQHPLLAMQTENLRLESQRALIDGSPCVILRETPPDDAGPARTLMIDPDRDGIIRRWIAGSADDGVQIDLSYRRDPHRGWLPESWTVLRFGAADRPVQQYVRGAIVSIADGEPLAPDRLRFAHPPGTWVVDRSRGEHYLVRTDDRRRVTEAEVRWLPTYAELLQTNSGQVGDLIEHRTRQAELWRSMRWLLLAAGLLLLAAAAARGRLGGRGCPAASANSDNARE